MKYVITKARCILDNNAVVTLKHDSYEYVVSDLDNFRTWLKQRLWQLHNYKVRTIRLNYYEEDI